MRPQHLNRRANRNEQLEALGGYIRIRVLAVGGAMRGDPSVVVWVVGWGVRASEPGCDRHQTGETNGGMAYLRMLDNVSVRPQT